MSKRNYSSLLSPRLARYFKDYSAYHMTRGNQLTHCFGISFIVLGLLGLLGSLVVGEGLTGMQYFRLDGGTLLLSLGVLFYLFVDWRIAIPFAFVLTGMYFLGRALPISLDWAFFVVGWILQGIGHIVYEKKSPAFFKNLTHLLIGPLWIFAKVIGYH